MSAAPVFKLIPTTQRYDWGKKGLESKVAQFAAAASVPDFALEHDAPYAELWMGTHPSSPARLLSGEPLSKHLAAHSELVGERVLARFENEGARAGNLPFLLKILAIAKALSIQTHPDKAMAERLHAERPDVYKDANHKPEMALALTDFTALCGFLPLPKIATYLASTPEFAALIPPTIAQRFGAIASSPTPTGPAEKAALRDLFAAVMTADETLFKTQLDALVRRYEHSAASEAEKDVQTLVLTLSAQFPGDIGVFCAFVLNYVTMGPGDAIFLAAGEPHAYISGDIVECMATSDNVIRAGLTPKLRDVPNLVEGLTYAAADPQKHLVQPTPFVRPTQLQKTSTHTVLYDPPIPEFSVLRVALPSGEQEVHAPIDGPSVSIVTGGKGSIRWGDRPIEVSEGDVFFVGAGAEVQFTQAGDKELVVYRAFVEAQ